MGLLSLGCLFAWSRGHRPLSIWAQVLSGHISSFPAGRGPGEQHGESDSEETREGMSIQDAGPFPGMISALPNMFKNGNPQKEHVEEPVWDYPSSPSPSLTPKSRMLLQLLDQVAEATLPTSQPHSQSPNTFSFSSPGFLNSATHQQMAQGQLRATAPLPAEPLVLSESFAGSDEELDLAQHMGKRSAGLGPPGLCAGNTHQY